MTCPKCHADVRVIESRKRRYDYYRRYQCRKCKHRFSTSEQLNTVTRKLREIKYLQKAINRTLDSLTKSV